MEDASFDEADKAFSEINHAIDKKNAFNKISKDGLALAEIYARMVDAERERERLQTRCDKFEDMLKKMQELSVR